MFLFKKLKKLWKGQTILRIALFSCAHPQLVSPPDIGPVALLSLGAALQSLEPKAVAAKSENMQAQTADRSPCTYSFLLTQKIIYSVSSMLLSTRIHEKENPRCSLHRASRMA